MNTKEKKAIEARMKMIPVKLHKEFPKEYLMYGAEVPTSKIPALYGNYEMYQILESDIERVNQLSQRITKAEKEVRKVQPYPNYPDFVVEEYPNRDCDKFIYAIKNKVEVKFDRKVYEKFIEKLKAEYAKKGMIIRGGHIRHDLYTPARPRPTSIWNGRQIQEFNSKWKKLAA